MRFKLDFITVLGECQMTLLGAYLKELRGTLSTGDVERETGIPRATLSRYERGENIPSPAKLKQLAEFYECPYSDLRIYFYDDLISELPEEAGVLIAWVLQRALMEGSERAAITAWAKEHLSITPED